jgi:hypothetical protein
MLDQTQILYIISFHFNCRNNSPFMLLSLLLEDTVMFCSHDTYVKILMCSCKDLDIKLFVTNNFIYDIQFLMVNIT